MICSPDKRRRRPCSGLTGTVAGVSQSTAGGPADASAASGPLTPETAHLVLAAACEQAGLDSSGAELIRIGSNAVYRLHEPVIVRIAAGPAENARKQVAVARWLAASNYPATRALDVDQPISVDGRVVTFWVSVSEREEYARIDQVAGLIRWLHELDPPSSLVLPEVRPFDKAHAAVDLLTGVSSVDADFLGSLLTELQAQYRALKFTLRSGPIHGDANVGNVILDRNGEPVLIDLDSFGTGPREWDLVQTALFYERFGWHTEEEYRTFVDVYGFDIMGWPGYRVLAAAREVMMTLWLGRKAGTSEQAAAETGKRIEAIRRGGSRRDWAPF